IVLALVMSLPSAAKTPVRSVSTPRLMVLPSTPKSVWTSAAAPPLADDDPPLSCALLLQPLAAATTATAASAEAARFIVRCFMWCSLVLVGRTGHRWWRGRSRPRRAGRPARPRRFGRGGRGGPPAPGMAAGLTPPAAEAPGQTGEAAGLEEDDQDDREAVEVARH